MSNNLNLARLSNILADIKSRRDSDIASKVSETVFTTHVNDDVSHITNGERTAWNSKAEGTHTHRSEDIPELRDLISTTNNNYNDLSAAINALSTQVAENMANIEILLEDTAEIDETTINNLLTDVFGE